MADVAFDVDPGSVRMRLRVMVRGALPLLGGTFVRRTRTSPRLWRAIVYVPADADSIHLDVFGAPRSLAAASLCLRRIGRTHAASRLMLGDPRRSLGVMGGNPARLPDRVRRMLAQLATQANAPHSYAEWVDLFDTWTERDRAALASSARVLALVFRAPGQGDAALAATMNALDAQWLRPTIRVAGKALPPDGTHDYVALIQAGEVLPEHALAVLAARLDADDAPAAVFADEDALSRDNWRMQPLFKPEASRTLALSGTLTRGVWMMRRTHAGALDFAWAEATRIDWLLRLMETGETVRRVPYVLTHRRADTASAPAEAMAAIVRAHLARTGLHARLDGDAMPLRARPIASGRPPVTIVVPSACRGPHVARCLRALLTDTAYPSFELLVVVTQTEAPDEAQRAVLAEISEDRRVRVLLLGRPAFNYSAANNFAAANSDRPLLCLVNDDVAPLDPDWLDVMVAHLEDPRIGAVGAKLLYADRTVQHGGVIMGLAGLCEHAYRGLPADAPGHGGRAALDHEVSAATGACLLVRRSAFEQVGGLDETLAIAFNDVDFCLKLRTAGWGIVMAETARLWHHESQSLGHHFSGERADLEAVEVARMQQRWAAVCADDPFHNPNLSLHVGQEGELSFPPRVRRPGQLIG